MWLQLAASQGSVCMLSQAMTLNRGFDFGTIRASGLQSIFLRVPSSAYDVLRTNCSGR